MGGDGTNCTVSPLFPLRTACVAVVDDCSVCVCRNRGTNRRSEGSDLIGWIYLSLAITDHPFVRDNKTGIWGTI